MIEGITQNEDLSLYSTYRIGGPADYFYKLKNADDLPAAISFAKEKNIPYFLIGGGTNILFSDKGFRGLIIKNESAKIVAKDNQITADSGVLISNLIRFSFDNHLTGLEKWWGLPGTVGGAVRGNAGCNGLETKDILVKAKVLDPETNEIKEVKNDYFNFDYRASKLKESNEILLSATFKLEKTETPVADQLKVAQETAKKRHASQPPGLTAGSFFKNPSPEKPAGLLIDQAGLKGKEVGGAKISEKHANFFLNAKGATQKDILELATLAKREVKAKSGIDLR